MERLTSHFVRSKALHRQLQQSTLSLSFLFSLISGNSEVGIPGLFFVSLERWFLLSLPHFPSPHSHRIIAGLGANKGCEKDLSFSLTDGRRGRKRIQQFAMKSPAVPQVPQLLEGFLKDSEIFSHCERFGASNLQLLEKSFPLLFRFSLFLRPYRVFPSPPLRTLSSRQCKQKPELEIRVKGAFAHHGRQIFFASLWHSLSLLSEVRPPPKNAIMLFNHTFSHFLAQKPSPSTFLRWEASSYLSERWQIASFPLKKGKLLGG